MTISDTGKLYYVEIPATDIEQSATFYREVFGWSIRERGDGATAFDDSAGHVSGTWSTNLPIVDEPGFRLYISVADAESASRAIEAAGGTIVDRGDLTVADIVVTFRDPAGNLLAIHQYKPENASGQS